MLSLPRAVRVYVSVHPTNMHKSFDGLSALGRGVMGAGPDVGSPVCSCRSSGGPGEGAVLGPVGVLRVKQTTGAWAFFYSLVETGFGWGGGDGVRETRSLARGN